MLIERQKFVEEKLYFQIDESLIEEGKVSDFIDQIKSYINHNIDSVKSAVKFLIQLFKKISKFKLGVKTKILTAVFTTLLNVLGADEFANSVSSATIDATSKSESTHQSIEVVDDIIKDLIDSDKELSIDKFLPDETGNTEDFLEKLAFKESSNNWQEFKDAGNYIGKYQLSQMALQDINRQVDTQQFKNNPEVFPESEQDQAVIDWLQKNEQYLQDYIQQYEGQIINGILMTRSGILAGAHLMGNQNVKDFLDSNGTKIPEDGNGTSIIEYIYEFGGYRLNLNNK